MNLLRKEFDKYSFNARVMPAFFLVFPVVITILTWYEPSRSWGGVVTTFIVTFGIISFAANQLSTKGNILQNRLFEKWGGAPTTIIMRYSDSTLDRYTKKRYLTKLATLIPSFPKITPELEKLKPKEVDELYRSATNYLREKTRDPKHYPLVLKENINYGFSRNIRAVKWLGLTLTISSLGSSLGVLWYKHLKDVSSPNIDLIFTIPFVHISIAPLLFLIIFTWCFWVTEKWVKIRAFAYARALFSSCEK